MLKWAGITADRDYDKLENAREVSSKKKKKMLGRLTRLNRFKKKKIASEENEDKIALKKCVYWIW